MRIITRQGQMSKQGHVGARIGDALITRAESVFAQKGLGHSEAIRLFYEEVARCGDLPFTVHRRENASTTDSRGGNSDRVAPGETGNFFRELGL